MAILETIVAEITKHFLHTLKEKGVSHQEDSEEMLLDEVRPKVASHLKEVLNWSERVQFYGMSRAEDTEGSTISLTLDTIPRKFRGARETEKVPERALVSDPQHYVLLGDPGSGKTTTLKRLSRAILTSEPLSSGDQWQLPVVLRLREAPPTDPVSKVIADIFGMKYQEKQKKVERLELGANGKWYPVVDTVTVYTLAGRPLENIIAALLDDSNALLLLDGLDEVAISKRIFLEQSIEILARKMRASKIIVSCRSGDYVHPLEGFESLEICPLDWEQVQTIASRWLPESADFLRRLQALPFHDLATKPLFLCQLIVFYRNTGYLPEQPAAVYRRIIRLSLEDWDAQRRVQRRSRYAGFDPDQKLDFLAALSYQLTYQIKTKRFSTKQLIRAYTAVCASYSLPPTEAQMVAKEIESHTGIILESGDHYYEFSHLSLQEYLCAYYLVREPFAREIGRYLAEYPAPVAVAVSLAANPSHWFAALILNKSNWSLRGTAVSSLLSRLVQEKPQFGKSAFLGFALLKIMFLYGEAIKSYIEDFLSSSEVRESLAQALRSYDLDVSRSYPEEYRLSLRRKGAESHDFKIDIGGTLSRDLYLWIAGKCQIQLVKVSKSGQVFEIIKDRVRMG